MVEVSGDRSRLHVTNVTCVCICNYVSYIYIYTYIYIYIYIYICVFWYASEIYPDPLQSQDLGPLQRS